MVKRVKVIGVGSKIKHSEFWYYYLILNNNFAIAINKPGWRMRLISFIFGFKIYSKYEDKKYTETVFFIGLNKSHKDMIRVIDNAFFQYEIKDGAKI